MKMSILLLLAGAGAGGVTHSAGPIPMAPAPLHVQPPAPKDFAARHDGQRARPARYPGFAPELSDMPGISGPKGWGNGDQQGALALLAAAQPTTRQQARWAYATSLIADGEFADALGVLDVMLQDDSDLGLVSNFQLSRGAVLAALGRSREALSALESAALQNNPEACFWRATAFAQAGMDDEALRQFGCARAALAARPGPQRIPFLTALAEAAIARQQPDLALRWLAVAPDGDASANIVRGRAYMAMNKLGEARIRLGRAERSGNEPQRYAARLALIEMAVAQRTMSVADARREVDHIRFVWRGGPIEEQALRLSFDLAKKTGDTRGALSAGSTLVRYFDLGPGLSPLLADVQAQLAGLVAPGNRMQLADAAGLYWDYRDLMPAGAAGDQLISRLADRLESSGLYARAAELLDFQLRHRALDIAQGPLSVRVATLQILAGRPDRALAAIRDTQRTIFPQPMLWDRARIQAVALHQLGKTQEALAALEDVPDTSGLRSELLWKRSDWSHLIVASAPILPGPGALNEVEQAVVLRYAIALGMLGREDEIARLRGRYETAFATLKTAPAFDLLTREPGSVDQDTLMRAMSAIPSASPAGSYADLLDVSVAKTAQK